MMLWHYFETSARKCGNIDGRVHVLSQESMTNLNMRID